jgi:hypothetical protein
MTKYLNLQIGAAARLAILKRDCEQWKKQYPSSQVETWRDVRFANLRSQSGLAQGLSNKEPVWYCHDGEQFRNERDSHSVTRMDHTGWFTDIDCSSTAIGIVASLPHGKFIAGYRWTENDERIYYPEIFDDENDAAHMADEHARVFAEDEQENDRIGNEASKLQDKNEQALQRLRECIVLRHNKCMDYVRDEVAELISTIRKNRDELKTTYKNYI